VIFWRNIQSAVKNSTNYPTHSHTIFRSHEIGSLQHTIPKISCESSLVTCPPYFFPPCEVAEPVAYISCLWSKKEVLTIQWLWILGSRFVILILLFFFFVYKYLSFTNHLYDFLTGYCCHSNIIFRLFYTKKEGRALYFGERELLKNL
jgi:hypothetical protein